MAKIRRRKSLKSNTPPEEEVTPIFPFEIIEIILLSIPVKSLLRFKSVSKSWYTLISDSKFGRVHLQQSIMKSVNNNVLIYPPPWKKTSPYFRLENLNFQIESIELPIGPQTCREVLCTCEGLVLLGNTREHQMYVLWNPSTRAYTEFLCPFELSMLWKTFGLCYNASNDDYKVVCIYDKHNMEGKFLFRGFVSYYFKNDFWTEERNSSRVGEIVPGPGLFVNGAVHWVKSEVSKVFDSNSGNSDYGTDIERGIVSGLHHFPDDLANNYKCIHGLTFEILCFDSRDDKLKKFSLPTCFDDGSLFQLSALKGKLSICRYTYNFIMVEIWMMKEYGDCNSWTKLITIDNVPARRNVHQFNKCYYVKPLYLTNEGIYILEITQSGLVIYNSKENKFDEIVVQDKEDSNFLCLNDSLLFPSRINEATGSS